MTIHLPTVIDPHGMEPIIAAVRSAYVRKPVPINPKLDLAALASDIRRAVLRHNILRDMQKGKWNKRFRRGRKLLKAKTADAVVKLLTDGDLGAWWLKTFTEMVTSDEFEAWSSRRGSLGLSWPETIAAKLGVAEVRVRVQRLLAERFTSKGAPRSARAILGKGSALDWLIRRRPSNLGEHESFCLPTIFKRHFGLTARINISHKLTGAGPRQYTHSPYLEFVRAVLTAEGIKPNSGTICTIFNRRN